MDFTRTEFLAYTLIYVAHCNHIETEEEEKYILSKIDKKTYDKIHTEVVLDSDEISLNKIQQYINNQNFNQKEKEDLIHEIKNVCFADGTVDLIEKKVFYTLKKMIN